MDDINKEKEKEGKKNKETDEIYEKWKQWVTCTYIGK